MTKPDPKRFLDLARAAAVENAAEKSVSSFVELIDEGDGAFSFVFESKLEGYQGWLWSVTLYDSGDEAPTISEVVLLPGENALLAPAWVPWSERLADWKALQVELEARLQVLGVLISRGTVVAVVDPQHGDVRLSLHREVQDRGFIGPEIRRNNRAGPREGDGPGDHLEGRLGAQFAVQTDDFSRIQDH